MNNINIGEKVVGPNNPCFIIAEIGQAHDGSLGAAHAYIDAVAEAGVDAVKFQTHIASAESTKHEKFRVKVFPQDETRYDYWKRMEFTASQWAGLSEHANRLGLIFLSTPFSTEAVDLLEGLNVPAYKVGSGDTNNEVLIQRIIKTGKPILLSSGMSGYDELGKTVEQVTAANTELALFQCTTSYPCAPEDVGYNVLEQLNQRFGTPVGLSDHSGTIFPSLASVALGASLIEVHAVFSKQCFGPDTLSSLTISELKQLVDGIRFIEKGLSVRVNKDVAADSRGETKRLFARSAFYRKNMNIGEVISTDSFAMKKPGGGLNFTEVSALLGKELKKQKSFDDFVEKGDFYE